MAKEKQNKVGKYGVFDFWVVIFVFSNKNNDIMASVFGGKARHFRTGFCLPPNVHFYCHSGPYY